MTHLKQAISEGRIDRFIAHREAEGQPPGDEHKLKRVLSAMARSGKSARETLKRDRADD